MNETICENILNNLFGYFYWDIGTKKVCLDGDFTLDELRAIVWWMKNKQKPPNKSMHLTENDETVFVK